MTPRRIRRDVVVQVIMAEKSRMMMAMRVEGFVFFQLFHHFRLAPPEYERADALLAFFPGSGKPARINQDTLLRVHQEDGQRPVDPGAGVRRQRPVGITFI
jgi:hypothetical protein